MIQPSRPRAAVVPVVARVAAVVGELVEWDPRARAVGVGVSSRWVLSTGSREDLGGGGGSGRCTGPGSAVPAGRNSVPSPWAIRSSRSEAVAMSHRRSGSWSIIAAMAPPSGPACSTGRASPRAIACSVASGLACAS